MQKVALLTLILPWVPFDPVSARHHSWPICSFLYLAARVLCFNLSHSHLSSITARSAVRSWSGNRWATVTSAPIAISVPVISTRHYELHTSKAAFLIHRPQTKLFSSSPLGKTRARIITLHRLPDLKPTINNKPPTNHPYIIANR